MSRNARRLGVVTRTAFVALGLFVGVPHLAAQSPPSLSIDDASTPEGHALAHPAVFTVSLSAPNPGPGTITVQWSTADGTAKAGSDYQSASGTLFFFPGALTVTLSVDVIGDVAVEQDETFFVNLSNPVGATLAEGQGTGTVQNDDAVVPGPAPGDGRLLWTIAQQGIPSLAAAGYGGTPNPVYVLFAYRGEIFTSPDGIIWTQRPTPAGTRTYMDVHWNGSLFVAVGDDCCGGVGNGPGILTSTNGIDWTFVDVSSVAPGRWLSGVTYANGQWLAVGQQGTVLKSNDGTTWSLSSAGTASNLFDVAFGNGTFVAVGDNRELRTSSDGSSWELRSYPADAGRNLRRLGWTGSRFVVTSFGGPILSSVDGISWQVSQECCVPEGQVGVGAGHVVVGNHNSFLVSSDGGATWTTVLPAEDTPNGVATNDGFGALTYGDSHGFVAGGFGGAIFTSPDGTTRWQSRTWPTSRFWAALTASDTRFCAVGQDNAGAWSDDGATWTLSSVFGPTTYTGWSRYRHKNVTWGAGLGGPGVGRFVAANGEGSLFTSADCDVWTELNLTLNWAHQGEALHLHDVAWGNGLFVAIGYRVPENGTVANLIPLTFVSADGDTWTEYPLPLPEGYEPRAVAFGNGLFVGGAGGSGVIVSRDGISWSTRPAPFTDWIDLIFANGQFVAATGDGLRTSPDAVTWTRRSIPGQSEYGVGYGEGTYVAVDWMGHIEGSPDAVIWTSNTSPTVHDLYDVAYLASLGRLVVLGDSVLLYSTGMAPPRVAINDLSVTEGNAGTTDALVPVVLLGGDGTHTVTVPYSTANGSAISPNDFQETTGAVTFGPGQWLAYATVPVVGDTIGESNESFTVNLGTPSFGTLADGQATVSILTDDPLPAAISDVTVPEGNDGTRIAYFSVSLSSDFDQPITMDYKTANGTATEGEDYLASAGSLTIDPGLRSSVPIAISIIGDELVEDNETFTVTISNARYGGTPVTVTKATGTGTILDDEDVVKPSTEATWTLAQEGMFRFWGLASDGSQYAVVGQFGEIWTSPDGVAWTQRANPDHNPASGAARNLRGVTYGAFDGGRWVAVGAWDNLTSDPSRRYPIVLTSIDAATWTLQDVSAATQNTNRNLLDVSYGAGLYVAVGSGGCGPSNARATCILTSPDGVDWTYRPSPINSSLNRISFGTPSGSSLFVAVGPNRTVLTSPDGVGWSQALVPSTMPANLNAVAWNGAQFVVVGGDIAGLSPAIMTSPDGFNWTRQTVPPEMLYAFYGVGSGGGLSVAVALANLADPTGTSIVTSSDGVTWTRRSLKSIPPGVSPSLRIVGFGPKGFVAGGIWGNLYTSSNGTTAWTSRTLAASRAHNGLAFANGIFCSAGTNGAIRRSADGVTWTQASSPPDQLAYPQWIAVVYAGGRFWTAGRNSSIASSTDCDTWSVRYPATPVLPADPATSFLNDLAYGQIGGSGVLVAVGERYPTPDSTETITPLILSSIDSGATWTERAAVVPPGVQQSFVTVAYGNGRFVAFGTDWITGEQFLNTSDDGLTWTARPTDVFDDGSSEAVNDLAYGNGLFVAVGSRIRTSPDGIDWTLRQNWGDSFAGVAYGSDRFVAVGASGVAYVSADGMIWTPGSTATDHTLLAVAASADSNRFVAVGNSAVAYTDLAPPVSPPAISIGEASVPEGKSTTALPFTVSLSRAGSQTVTVQYVTANGTATAGSDYVAASGTLTFQPGETEKTLSVGVLGDSVYERDETVYVNLSSPTNAAIADATGVGTILNDDPKPALTIKDASVTEGNSGTTPLTFTVTLSPASGIATSVSWATRDGTALAGQDYVADSGVLVFNPGETSKPVTVRVKGDRTRESNETVFVDLTQPVDAVISGGTAKGTIKNDD